MRLGIYAIAKNEEAHVMRFLQAVLSELKPEDSITIVDTGSTDDTWHLFYGNGVMPHRISVNPWRFDDARNAALALVPNGMDAVWSLDLDEVPQPGWRDAIERAWSPELTRVRYKFVWSWLEDGREGVTYWADKLHARRGGRWRLPCHEVLEFDREERHVWSDELVLHHYPDEGKSRGSYDALMEVAIKEAPDDDRVQHYYARQLYFQGRLVEASEAFQAHLANPRATWAHERSESMLYLSRMWNEAGARMWLHRAVAECPSRKEVWYELAKHEAGRGNYLLALGYLDELERAAHDSYYLSDPEAQGDGPGRLRESIFEKLEVSHESRVADGEAAVNAAGHHPPGAGAPVREPSGEPGGQAELVSWRPAPGQGGEHSGAGGAGHPELE